MSPVEDGLSSAEIARGKGGKLERTADLDGRLELEEDGLIDEDLASFGAEELDLVLLKLNLLPWAVAANCGAKDLISNRSQHAR
jgi:hypothetical protein